jgi:hypothetical protein
MTMMTAVTPTTDSSAAMSRPNKDAGRSVNIIASFGNGLASTIEERYRPACNEL